MMIKVVKIRKLIFCGYFGVGNIFFMKKSYIAGISLFVIAAFFSLSLLLVLFDFGGMSAAHDSVFFGLGKFFANAYGACSVFIPIFLIFAASHCFIAKWHFRTGVLLSGSIIPFFTLVGIEKICRFFARSESGSMVGAKIFITILIGLMVIALEFLLLSIVGDMIERRILTRRIDEDSERPFDTEEETVVVPVYNSTDEVRVVEQSDETVSGMKKSVAEENGESVPPAVSTVREVQKPSLAEAHSPSYIGKLLHDSIQQKNEQTGLVSFDRLANDVDRLDLSGKKNPYASIFDEAEKKKAEEEKKAAAEKAKEETRKKRELEAKSEPALSPIDGIVFDDDLGEEETVDEVTVSEDETALSLEENVSAKVPFSAEDESNVSDEESVAFEEPVVSEKMTPSPDDDGVVHDETADAPISEQLSQDVSERQDELSAEETVNSEMIDEIRVEQFVPQESQGVAEEKSFAGGDIVVSEEKTDVSGEEDGLSSESAGFSEDEPTFSQETETPNVSSDSEYDRTPIGELEPDFFDIDMNADDEELEAELSRKEVEDEAAAARIEAEEESVPEVRVSLARASVIADNGEQFEIERDVPEGIAAAQREEIPVAPGNETEPFAIEDERIAADDVPAGEYAVSEEEPTDAEDAAGALPVEDDSGVPSSEPVDDTVSEISAEPSLSTYFGDDGDEIDGSGIEDEIFDEEEPGEEVFVGGGDDSIASEERADIPDESDSISDEGSEADSRLSVAAKAPVGRSWANYEVSTDLLEEYPNNEYWVIDEDTKLAAEKLKRTLNEFKIEAEVTGIRKGPVVTMFELLPAPGVKLSKIVALQDNIALTLAASSVRIVAPIPGKHAVGIEVPNKNRAIVSFKEIIDMDFPAFSTMGIPVVLGKDISGEPQIIDLAKTPHLLIAGSTGAGKSVCVNTMLLSILYKRSPSQVKLILVDPKIVELSLYNDIPHLLTPVITEPKRALQALQYCLCEMERRYALLSGMSVRDIVSYNEKIEVEHIATERLPYIVVVIDEFADLMMTTGKELETSIARLAAKSRAVGIHLVLATQRPSIDVITGLIKANLPSRIAFMVASKTDSRIIIDQVGAEKLLGKGDMLYSGSTAPFPVRIQGTLVSDEEVENVVEYVKSFGEPEYIDDEMFIDDDEGGDDGTMFHEDGQDPLYDQALEIVIQAGKASASYIQRKLSIGYNRAARLVEEMEERGIVGPANGSKPREIIHLP